jgi:hypothetical protein
MDALNKLDVKNKVFLKHNFINEYVFIAKKFETLSE